ncbi:hypothetical protein C8R44DRAFT_746414 [Mycena epipterygia]|nr:hypothetical protein C8R44DRAFT_746414 [Mycena epipterygia]
MKFSTTLFNVLAAAVLLSKTTDAKFVIGDVSFSYPCDPRFNNCAPLFSVGAMGTNQDGSVIASVKVDQNNVRNYCNQEFEICGKKVILGRSDRCGSSAYPRGNGDYYAQVLVNGQDVGRCVYDNTFHKTKVGLSYSQHIDSTVYCHADSICHLGISPPILYHRTERQLSKEIACTAKDSQQILGPQSCGRPKFFSMLIQAMVTLMV